MGEKGREKDWPHQVLILGPSTRRVDVIPLHHKAFSQISKKEIVYFINTIIFKKKCSFFIPTENAYCKKEMNRKWIIA